MDKTRVPQKLSRPRLFDAVDWERLFELLDKQHARPLVWLSGPPGSGKTTLVSTYLQQKRSAALWYRVDEGDADPATFFSFLRQAALALKLPPKKVPPPLTPEHLMDVPGFARRFFRSLFAALPMPGALVIDAYERASRGVLDDLLSIAVAEVPEELRIFITSREAPPASLRPAIVKGDLALVTWEELRLTLPEAQAIAGNSLGAKQKASVATLHAHADGWAAGFVVLLAYVGREGGAYVQAMGGMREALFQYFIAELFGRADEATRFLLMTTALMPGFTSAQAEAVSGNPEAATLLSGLYRQHYFIDRTEAADPEYRYHALFRDFLLEMGRSKFTASERRELLLRAAAALEESGQREDAVALLSEAEEWSQLVPLLCGLAPEWLGHGRHATLSRTLSVLPQDFFQKEPWLSFWLGIARLPFEPARARAALEAAYEQFATAGDDVGSMQACCGVLLSYFMEWNDLRAVDRWREVYQSLAARGRAFPTIETEIRALGSLHATLFRSAHGAADFIRSASERALELMTMTTDPALRLGAAVFAIWVFLFQGEWRRMRQLIADVNGSIDLSGLPPADVLVWHVGEKTYFEMTGDFPGAFAAMERARRLAESSGVRILDLFLAAHECYVALHSGDLPRAESCRLRMRGALNPARVLDVVNCEFIEGALAMVHGDWGLARRVLRSGLEKTVACGADLSTAQLRVSAGMVHAELGEYTSALDEGRWLVEYGIAAQHSVFQYGGLLVLAYADLRSGETPAAIETLRLALKLAREREYVMVVPYVHAKALQTLYAAALEHGIEADFVIAVVRQLKIAPPEDVPEFWPWPVRIRTLGRFEIEVDGAPMEFGRKAPRRPLQLVKWLIAQRGQASAEAAIDALWPDDEADAAANALETALYRVRRLLGSATAIEFQEGVLRMDSRLVHVDAFAFEDKLDAARGESVRVARALSSYRGPFLPGDLSEPWTISARERLHARFLREAVACGRSLEGAKKFVVAAEHYARAIDIDDVAEVLYQGLMRCQVALDQRNEGIGTYARLQRTLDARLGIKPAAASELLLRVLRQQ